jgi:CubicO group peptidase (beta-lactamase class C family)
MREIKKTSIQHRRQKILFFGLAVILSGCAPLSQRIIDSPDDAVLKINSGQKTENTVADVVCPLFDQGEACHVNVGVLTPNRGMEYFCFRSDHLAEQTNTMVTTELFQIGSLSKLFVARILSDMVGTGELRYSDRLRDLVEPGLQLGSGVGEVSIGDLVRHTSGLPRQPSSFLQLRYFVRYLFTGKDIYAYLSEAKLYEYLGSARVKSRVEHGYQYSNIGFAVLAHLLTVRNGMNFEDLAKSRIFGPLGMDNTCFFPSASITNRIAEGHAGDQPLFLRRGRAMVSWRMTDVMYPVGGAYSTVEDMLRYADANLQELQIATNDPVLLGWQTEHLSKYGVTVYYSHGMISGYSAYIGIEPIANVAVVVLMANFNWDDKIGHNLLLRLSLSHYLELSSKSR